MMQKTKFFSVPAHTPVVLSEAGDCGTTMIRVQCKDMVGNHETRHLNNYCPGWVMDTVCQVDSSHSANALKYSKL